MATSASDVEALRPPDDPPLLSTVPPLLEVLDDLPVAPEPSVDPDSDPLLTEDGFEAVVTGFLGFFGGGLGVDVGADVTVAE